MRPTIIVIATAMPGVAFAQAEMAAPEPAPEAPASSAEPAPPPAPAPAPAPEAPPTAAPSPSQPATAQPAAPALVLTVGGYVEVYYQGQFQNPSNRITNLRGYDNRSRTFTLSNVVLDAKGETGPITTHVIFQIGHTGATYYLAEPFSLGTSSVDTSDTNLWRYLQAANVTAKLPDEWLLEAGLFASPIGIEVLAVKDNFNWSRSNVFFALPTYHTGVMLSRPLRGGWTGKFHVYNGWNSIVDNNGYPSVALSGLYAKDKTSAQLLYFGGIERPTGSPEGTPWRNLFDALGQFALTDTITLAGQVDAGFELNEIGTAWWAAAAGYVRYAFDPQLYVAVRGDYFHEKVPLGGGIRSGAIFFPTKWVASGTITLAYQPIDHISARLEYRHDHAASDVYFGDDVVLDPVTEAWVPNRDMQDTLLLGVTAWF